VNGGTKKLRIHHYVSIIALLALIPILILGVILAYDLVQEGERLKNQQLFTASQISREIEALLKTNTLAIDTLAKQMESMSVSPNDLHEVMVEVANHYPGFSEIYLHTSQYRLSSRNVSRQNVLDEYSAEKVKLLNSNLQVADFIQWKKTIVSPLVEIRESEKTVFIATPIYKDSAQPEGFVMGMLDLAYLESLIAQYKIPSSGYTVLVDSRQNIISFPGEKEGISPDNLAPLLSATRAEEESFVDFFSSAAQRWEISLFSAVKGYDWGLWVIMPQQETMMPLYRVLGLSLILLLLSVIVIIVIRNLLVVNIARPLTLLNQICARYATGNLDSRVEYHDKSLPLEIVTLGERFNAMADNVQQNNILLKMHSDELEVRVLERTRELLMKNKELAALYAVVSSISSTENLKSVLLDVLRVIVDFFEVEVSSIIVYKDDGDKLFHTIWRKDYPESLKLLYTDSVVSYSRRAIISGTPLVIDDFERNNMEALSGIELCGIKSLVSVPIVNKGFILGTITLSSTVSQRFGKQDLNVLQGICNQLGVVVTNVSLFNVINEEHNTLLAVMNSINEGIILIDSRAKIIYANPVFIKTFGFENIDWQGLAFQDLQNYKSSLQVKMPYNEMWEDFIKERIYQYHEAVVVNKEKNDYYLIIGFPVLSNENMIGYGYLARNITREKEIDSLKNSILSTVSHELRTPLTTIRGSVESLLRKDVKWSGQEKEEFLTAIVEESKRLRDLIDNIMDMSKIEAGALNLDIHSADIHKLIDRVVNRFRKRYPKAQFSVDFDTGMPFALIDERRIEQVISNLTENGIKYSPTRPMIQIATKYLADRNMAKISVIDNGIGIDPRYHEAVFARFYRVDNPQIKSISGSGVGLSIARGIVEAHGGRISVHSVPSEGSRFDFTLPCE